MAGHGAPSGEKTGAGVDGSGTRVLLCCAGEDRFALAPAVERLSRESVEVELVSGVEYDPTRLEAAIKRYGPGALYVLCRSDRLDRFKLTRLQLMLKREGLADEQVLPVKLLAERPESVSNPVLERIRQAPSTSRPSRPSRPPPPPSGPAVAADADDDDAATVPVRLRDILEAEKPPAPAPATTPPTPTPATTPAPPAPATAPRTPTPAPSASAPSANAVTPMDDGLDLELAALGNRKRLPMIVAGVAALGLLVVGGVMMLGREDEPEPVESPTTSPEGDEAPEPETPPAPEPAETGTPEPAPSETGAPEPETPPEPGPDPEPAPEPEPEPEPIDAPPPPEPGTFDLTPAEEHAAMMEALRSRRVRAFDLIVYVPKVSRYGNVPRAQKYCAEMEVEGLKGWRLPTAAELRALLEADLINRSRYWTNQSVSAKKHVMIEGRNRRAAVKKTSYKGGRALCVRGETEPDAGE